jgi:hypothetical protein
MEETSLSGATTKNSHERHIGIIGSKRFEDYKVGM